VNQVIRWSESKGVGKGVVNYRLRDWLISRQRYWGAPIPILYCEKCGEVPVPEEQLPVILPPVENYQPSGTGESPLAGIPEFVHTTCPACAGPAKRETDTMGGFACSSWYFLRFADPHNDQAPFSQQAVDYWLPVDLYSGGTEHAVMHLLYARFWTKVMFDAGLVKFEEPFSRLRSQGMLLAWTPGRIIQAGEAAPSGEEEPDELIDNWKVLKPEERLTIPESEWVYRWVKMSKSKGNVVTPDEIAETFGADTLRIYTLFVAPFEETVQWEDSGIDGAFRYVNRVWRLWNDLRPHHRPGWQAAGNPQFEKDRLKSLRRKLHQTIRKVDSDIENFRFNTAVAALMELTNEFSGLRNELEGRQPEAEERRLISECVETLPLLLSPIAPHLAEEMWELLGHPQSIYREAWPQVDEAAAAEEMMTVVVQVNGRLRERLLVVVGTTDIDIERLALQSEKVAAEIAGRQVRKVVVVPGKLVNVVV
jgi:leucyl-tRNA synthetase